MAFDYFVEQYSRKGRNSHGSEFFSSEFINLNLFVSNVSTIIEVLNVTIDNKKILSVCA